MSCHQPRKKRRHAIWGALSFSNQARLSTHIKTDTRILGIASQPVYPTPPPPSPQKSKLASPPAWRNTSRPGTRQAGHTLAGYRGKARRKSAAQPATRSPGAPGGKSCSKRSRMTRHWMKSSVQEDAVTRASFAGPRSDFETVGLSSRFVTGFSKSGGGKCMIYMYYKSQKPGGIHIKYRVSCSTNRHERGNNA
jgi:hypothetical protein